MLVLVVFSPLPVFGAASDLPAAQIVIQTAPDYTSTELRPRLFSGPEFTFFSLHECLITYPHLHKQRCGGVDLQIHTCKFTQM